MSDNIKVGDMRHYLKAKTRSSSKTTGGQIVYTWTYSFSFYASSESDKRSESFLGVAPVAKTSVTFQTWIRDDLKRDMRVTYEDEDYNIVSVSRGFKTMRIECERVE